MIRVSERSRPAPVRRPATATLIVVCLLALAAGAAVRAQTPQASPALAQAPAQTPAPNQLPTSPLSAADEGMTWPRALHEMRVAVFRLPLAAALGTVLALRPKRRGTPTRTPAVVQTQIMLAVVGAVIMLVVGASLARAFGIVGAANLIRYRSKVDDPKDAVVMLCALAVGLACGVGLYLLAVISTTFMGFALWVIESFEPERLKHFELTVKAPEHSEQLRRPVEQTLRRYRIKYEIRTLSEEALSYDVHVPFELQTDQISSELDKLHAKGPLTVDWSEKKSKDK
jgi:uncharacterized membrane protein YhiD involved in acid resistance